MSAVSGELVHASKLSADWYMLVPYACSQPKPAHAAWPNQSHTLSLSLCPGHDCMGSGILYYIGLVNCTIVLPCLSFITAKVRQQEVRHLLAYGQIIIQLAHRHGGKGWLAFSVSRGWSQLVSSGSLTDGGYSAWGR